MIPKEIAGDPGALVIVDWSGWTRTAWAIGGIERTASIVCGWLARLLSDPMPPSLVIAVDPPSRWTFRHAATAHLPENERYKAGRSVPTLEYLKIEARLRQIVAAYRIPDLVPDAPELEQTWEADDSAARAVALARAEGRSVALITKDKDWLPLVTDDPTGPRVVRWPSSEVVDTEQSVIDTFGVRPSQMTDLLSMTGDSVDGVPGVKGMGPTGARAVLRAHGTMDAALAAEPTTRWERLLHRQRNAALFSRTLIRLWDEAPIEWDPGAQMVGGFDVPLLRRLYTSLGFTRLAESIPDFPKVELS